MGPVRAFLPARGSLALVAALLAASCLTPNPDFDPESSGNQDGGALSWDGMSVYLPGGNPSQPEADGSAGNQPAKDTAPANPSQSDFGRICQDQPDCAQDELCLFTEPEASKGICLRTCSDLDEPCPVPDPKLFSGCALYWNPDVGKVKLCVIFCKTPQGSFPCPNKTDYRCKVFESELGMCVPRQ